MSECCGGPSPGKPSAPRYRVIACHVLWRELCYFGALARPVIDFDFLEQGLHNEPDELRRRVQLAVDAAPENAYDAVLMGYGLCSNGLEGIVARHTRLVVPRAHDCITLLLGSKERYREYFDAHPGTYWYSPGWIDQDNMPGKDRHENMRRSYIETYGEENAAYLMEMEQAWIDNYSNAAYVDLGFGDNEAAKAYTRECAEWLDWNADFLEGNPKLVADFLNGNWSPEAFLVVKPGQRIAASHDEGVLTAVACE